MRDPLITIAGVAFYWAEPGALLFRARLHVDADGCPRAYHPVSGQGLDDLANAQSDGKWCGIAVDDEHQPYVQGPNDPAPGYYVSTTSLTNDRFKKHDPRRYVDAQSVPYVVLPGGCAVAKILADKQVGLGSLAVVHRPTHGQLVGAVYADTGPATEVGEGSMRLAQALGFSPDARAGGTEDRELWYVVFPQPGIILEPWPLTASRVDQEAKARFDAWGGPTRLAQCLAEISGT
jgi:hypothetical protein